MEYIKNIINRLLNNVHSVDGQTSLLQQINECMLRRYKINVAGRLSVTPLEVEIFYVNKQGTPPFIDTNMHCMLDSKNPEELWQLQSARFGRLYYHLKGSGGIDVCLSDSPQYALCCTLKSARIGSTDVWRQTNVRNAIIERLAPLMHCEGREQIIAQINRMDAPQVLCPREQPITDGCVYHIRRNLRRKDKNASLPLRSFMDVWNKNMPLNTTQRVSLYMQAHPDENPIEVMRRNDCRFIPTEIRRKYNFRQSEKL